MKSLNIIQKIAKIGKIISKVFFYFAIVGASACFIALIGLTMVKIMQLDTNNEFFKEILDEESILADAFVSVIVGLIMCVGEIFIARRVETYFEHELKVKTPFTKELAKEMRWVGIFIIILSASIGLTCLIGVSIARAINSSISDLDFSNMSSIYLGLAFLLISLFCDYGAELRENSSSKNENVIDVEEK